MSKILQISYFKEIVESYPFTIRHQSFWSSIFSLRDISNNNQIIKIGLAVQTFCHFNEEENTYEIIPILIYTHILYIAILTTTIDQKKIRTIFIWNIIYYYYLFFFSCIWLFLFLFSFSFPTLSFSLSQYMNRKLFGQ